jgi:hypothetical protein
LLLDALTAQVEESFHAGRHHRHRRRVAREPLREWADHRDGLRVGSEELLEGTAVLDVHERGIRTLAGDQHVGVGQGDDADLALGVSVDRGGKFFVVGNGQHEQWPGRGRLGRAGERHPQGLAGGVDAVADAER